MKDLNELAEVAERDAQRFCDVHEKIKREVQRFIVGQEPVLDAALTALFAGGHVMLEGVPGLGKTMLVKSIGQAVDVPFSRIQFTPDMMPADIQGTNVLVETEGGGHELQFQEGPLVSSLVLADEINRATPRTQSALLEAMQERRVTIGGENFALPAPFLVIATQNPVEQAGTFELPEAQLDRFMLLHRLQYLKPEEEKEVLRRNTKLGVRRDGKGAVARAEFDVLDGQDKGSAEQLVRAMEDVQEVHVSETFIEHVIVILYFFNSLFPIFLTVNFS